MTAKKSARNWKKRLCLEDQKKARKKIVKMTNSFVNMKSWKKSRYMLPKTVFVAATFCMLYMAYNPSASSSSKGLSSKQGPLSMSQAELDSLYKGHRSVFVNFCPVWVELLKVSVVKSLWIILNKNLWKFEFSIQNWRSCLCFGFSYSKNLEKWVSDYKMMAQLTSRQLWEGQFFLKGKHTDRNREFKLSQLFAGCSELQISISTTMAPWNIQFSFYFFHIFGVK